MTKGTEADRLVDGVERSGIDQAASMTSRTDPLATDDDPALPDERQRARLAAVERTLRSVTLRLLERQVTVVEAIVALAAVVDETSPREMASATRQARREEMLSELARLEREGRGRAAVGLIARRFARDPKDPVEVESLSRKLRKWRAKISGPVPFGSIKIV